MPVGHPADRTSDTGTPEGADDPEVAGGDAAGPAELVGTRRRLRVGADRPVRTSTGHRILEHDGECSRPHGHDYEVTVEVVGRPTAEGWVADKRTVADAIEGWDHRLLVEAGDPLVEALSCRATARSSSTTRPRRR